MRLVCQATLIVKQQVLGEAGPIIAKALVERVLGECAEPLADAVEHRFLVASVLLVEELARLVAERTRLVVARRLQNIARLE